MICASWGCKSAPETRVLGTDCHFCIIVLPHLDVISMYFKHFCMCPIFIITRVMRINCRNDGNYLVSFKTHVLTLFLKSMS